MRTREGLKGSGHASRIVNVGAWVSLAGLGLDFAGASLLAVGLFRLENDYKRGSIRYWSPGEPNAPKGWRPTTGNKDIACYAIFEVDEQARGKAKGLLTWWSTGLLAVGFALQGIGIALSAWA